MPLLQYNGKTVIDFETMTMRIAPTFTVETVRVFYSQNRNGEKVKCYDDYPISENIVIPNWPERIDVFSNTGDLLFWLEAPEGKILGGISTEENGHKILLLDKLTMEIGR